MLNYIIWNGTPDLLSIGSFTIRWYGILFATGAIVAQQAGLYMFRKEGKPVKDGDTITLYIIVATLIGARLGHVIFYQPDMLWNDPLGVFLPFQFYPEFRFTGLQGLASHGGAIGILFALWLYARKKKPGQNYIQVLDRAVIVIALTGCFVRMGNFFNSEIIGKPTDAPTGVVFIHRVIASIEQDPSSEGVLASIKVDKNNPTMQGGKQPLDINITFKENVDKEKGIQYIETVVRYYLTNMNLYVSNGNDVVYEWNDTPQQLRASIHTIGIVRHPAQLYESFSSLLLFLLLFALWSRQKEKTPDGLIFGLFMIGLWGARFLHEFLKEDQVSFERQMTLNMGQILSIPMFITGIIVLIWVYKKHSKITKKHH